MKFILFPILILLACTSKEKKSPPCYSDIGIKEAKVVAESRIVDNEKVSQVIMYDIYGKPTLRKQNGNREVSFTYDGDKMLNTIIKSFPDEDQPFRFGAESVDSNIVTKNDDFGRPLEMRGADGGRVMFSYDGCDKEIQKYYDYAGDYFQEMQFYLKDGVIQKSIWLTPSDSKGQVTKYFNYKYDSKGKWIKREYETSAGNRILEKRTLTYYE